MEESLRKNELRVQEGSLRQLGYKPWATGEPEAFKNVQPTYKLSPCISQHFITLIAKGFNANADPDYLGYSLQRDSLQPLKAFNVARNSYSNWKQ